MTGDRTERVGRVLVGVIRQACADARAAGVEVAAAGADADLVRQLCQQAIGSHAAGERILLAHPANKTSLLLGTVPVADILPLGDLYYSQVVEWAGGAELPAPVATLAEECGGAAALDDVLRRYFDERALWQSAAASLAPTTRDALRAALDAARFVRARVGIVPKLGARTLGIDLHA